MTILSRNMRRGSGARTKNIQWTLFTIGAVAATSELNAQTANGVVVGGTIPNTSFFTRCVQSLLFTWASPATAATVVLDINGESQFGEPVSENITLAPGATAQSTFCYRRMTSIILVSTTGALVPTDTLSVGFTNVNPTIPMLAKLKSAKSVLGVKSQGQVATSQPTFVAQVAPFWNIVCTGTLAGNAGIVGATLVHVADGDPGL